MDHRDDVQTSTVALIGLLGTLGLFVIVLLLVVVYYQVQAREQYVKNVAVPFVELETIVAEQQAQLVEYRWIDREKHLVTIPIARAMELVVAELAAEQRSSKEELPSEPTAGSAAASGKSEPSSGGTHSKQQQELEQ